MRIPLRRSIRAPSRGEYRQARGATPCAGVPDRLSSAFLSSRAANGRDDASVIGKRVVQRPRTRCRDAIVATGGTTVGMRRLVLLPRRADITVALQTAERGIDGAAGQAS